MRFHRIVVCAAIVLTSGCAKPMSTEPGPAAERDATLIGDASTLPQHGRGSRAWLRIAGTVVTLDGTPRNVQFVVPEVDPPTSSSGYSNGLDVLVGRPPYTVSAYSTLRSIHWPRSAGPRRDDDRRLQPDPEGPVEPGTVFSPGRHSFTLIAGRDTAYFDFWAGFTPFAWWAGPDPDLWPVSSDGDGKAVDVIDWSRFETQPAWPPDGRAYFGPDSFGFIPSVRRPLDARLQRRTFYEIHGNRIYARSEGDTVHQDAWVVFSNGGHDKDSRYTPLVDFSDPGLPPDAAGAPDRYPVLHEQGLVGSPIGFRLQVSTRLANGMISVPAASGTYPNFDPLSVFRLPQVAGYWRVAVPGQAFAVARAVDADGNVDPLTAQQAIAIVDAVDGGGGTLEQRLQRRRILTFHVRPAPATGLTANARPGSR